MSGLVRAEPAAAAAPARVMICDDSATIRGAISRMLEADPGIQVVSKASNGRMAIEELKRTKVDVLVLDIEMPVLDGMAALPLLLQTDPGLKIVMASTLTTRGADIAMRALRMGAADYVPKPSTIGSTSDERFKLELISKVKGLARLRNRAALPPRPAAVVHDPSRAGAAAETTGDRQFHRRSPGVVYPDSGTWPFG